MRALHKGQAGVFNIAGDIRGEARLVERAFGLGAPALSEVLVFVTERLDQ
jgi:transposase, IS6 family